MANNEKKGFVVYLDIREVISDLTREQRGDLFTAMLDFAAGEETPQLDPVTGMAFRFISAQMRRDAEKYEQTCERRRKAGEKGGRPKKANGFSENQNNQLVFSKPDTETDTDTETETEKGTETDTDTVTVTDTEVQAALAAISTGASKHRTKFSNFPERTYTNFDELERLLLNAD